jgi:Spy/CpxP family protein refolding chaperone
MGSYCWKDDERHCYYYPCWWIPLAFVAAAFLLAADAAVVAAAVVVAAVVAAVAAAVHCLVENLDLEQQMFLEVLLEENEWDDQDDDE